MNQVLCNPKIKPEHLARKAIVYLRQSSEKQVRRNKESQRLQYDVELRYCRTPAPITGQSGADT